MALSVFCIGAVFVWETLSLGAVDERVRRYKAMLKIAAEGRTAWLRWVIICMTKSVNIFSNIPFFAHANSTKLCTACISSLNGISTNDQSLLLL